jgi:lysophospholipase L1-like esterase
VSYLAASVPSDAAGGEAPLVGHAASAGAPSGRTSCHAVVYIGDSTSEGLISSNYLPDRDLRLRAQYARVGATLHPEIAGAMSIVERLPDGTNAEDVARRLISQDFRGCWVIALGTNDTADVFVGGSVSQSTRIERMMSVIGEQPALWVNVKSLVGAGPYAEGNMELWNDALLEECPRYPNMRVFDWASVVRDSWFTTDGIHFTSPGYAARGRLLARALVEAFPASGETDGSRCVVR